MPVFLLAVMLVASAALVFLRSPAIPEVPASASEELRVAASDAAAAFAAPVDLFVQSAELQRDALAAGSGRKSLREMTRANDNINGLALVDRVTGKVLRDRGDDVPLPSPLSALPDRPQSTLADDQLIVSVPISPERVLIGSLRLSAPRIPGAPPDQRVLLARPDGGIVAQSAGAPDAPTTVVQAAAAGVARGQAGFAVDNSQLVPPQSAADVFAIPGSAAAPPPERVAAVGGAPVNGVAGTSGLAALVVRAVTLAPGATTDPGGMAAVAVAAGGVLGFLMLAALFVRPIRRLRDDVDRLVTDVDAGHEARSWIRRSRLRQVDLIARFAARLPLTAAGTRDLAPSVVPRLTLGGVAVLAVVGSVVIAALAGGFAAVHTQQAARTDVLVERSRATVEDTAERLERTLTEGLAAVQASASPTVGEARSDWAAEVSAMHASRPAFRSVYVRDAATNIVAVAGEYPRAETVPATPLAQLNQSGSEPIVTAAAPTHDGRFTVIAELDPRTLNTMLRHADRPTRVFDGGIRTVLGSDGYVSFSTLDDPVLRQAAVDATVAPLTEIERTSGAEELVATQRIGQTDATAKLGWVVLQHREVATARYTVDPVGRATTVIVGITALACLGLLAWGYVTTIQPLQRLADWLASNASASTDRVLGNCPPPRRLDEVGAVMAGLNHCLKRK
ncbi:hypothetical protein [Mycolicibacterium sp. XJ870]